MSALTILRAASRDVANERYVEVMEAIDALAELDASGRRVINAFHAIGKAVGIVEVARATRECEVSMLALDACLARCGVSA